MNNQNSEFITEFITELTLRCILIQHNRTGEWDLNGDGSRPVPDSDGDYNRADVYKWLGTEVVLA